MKTLWGVLGVTVVVATLALASGDASAGKMYRWTDQNGNPVVSDRPPPPGVAYTEISKSYTPDRRKRALREIPGATAGAADADGAPSDGWVKDPERCQQSRDRIAKLESASRVLMEDDTGATRVLNPEELAEELTKARESARRYCED